MPASAKTLLERAQNFAGFRSDRQRTLDARTAERRALRASSDSANPKSRIQNPKSSGDSRRSYDAAAVSRLTSDWFAAYTSGDAELRGAVRRIIARSRDQWRNNDYVRGFIGDAKSNVIGAARMDLRMDIHDIGPKGAKSPDTRANKLIEAGWKQWSKRQWRRTKRLALAHTIADGAVLYRHIRGAAARNRFNYRVQLLEIDQLDLDNHQNLADGGTIRFGIEKAAGDDNPRAFHIFASHPGDDVPKQPTNGRGARDVIRVPASDMGILQLEDRITATLSPSWFVSCITRLKHLGAYEEAEVVAARVGACKGGFFTKKDGSTAQYPNDPNSERTTMDAEPGHFEELPAGLEFQEYDPTHPNTAFDPFRKAMLRGVSTALGVSYTTLGNDLESVNYSSARVGILDEREVWKELQAWFDEDFREVIFQEWLLMALTSGEVKLPLVKFDKFNSPAFAARRWAWVDPLKDLKAAELGIALRTTSRRQIIEENGGRVEDVFAANRDDEALATQLQLSLVPPDPTPSGSTQAVTTTSGKVIPDGEEEEEEED